jgi:ABC-type lipoprotein export system ATPase subunit
MYIKSLIYEDQSTGWKLEKIEFNNPLTLLVGVSGVGKTQILNALLNIKKISQGKSLNGLKWEIEFITSNGNNCEWIGQFENKKFVSNEEDEINIVNEKLSINHDTIIDRNENGIFFRKEKTIDLSPQESIISLLKVQKEIKNIYKDFKNIFDSSNVGDEIHSTEFDFGNEQLQYNLEKYKTIDAIRNSNQSIEKKLFFLFRNQQNNFIKIQESFIDIFPYIENIEIELVNHKNVLFYISLKIKEKNVSGWISDSKISSGMLKTFFHIAELYLCADNSVILIDEFENSLGINCIDELTSSILTSERNLQFIITSHHPYIINKIDCHYWKLVTRKGSVVKAEDATLYGIGRSKHEAFTQLLNLDEYIEGIES